MDRGISPVVAVLLMVVLTILLAGMFTVVFPQLFDLETVSGAADGFMTLGADDLDEREVVYTDEQGGLHSIGPDGDRTTYHPSNGGDLQVEGIGSKEVDFDGDGRREVPYVGGSNQLALIDESGDREVLVSDARKTLVGVGTWGGAGLSEQQAIYYVNDTNDDLYRVAPGLSPELVLSSSGFKAVVGIADYNGDGDADLVYLDNSGEPAYLDGGTPHDIGFGQVGHASSYGVGAPRAASGSLRAPVVNNAQQVVLLEASGSTEVLSTVESPRKASVAAIDWTGDSSTDVVYVSNSGNLYYVTQDGKNEQITDSYGNPVVADADQGVA